MLNGSGVSFDRGSGCVFGGDEGVDWGGLESILCVELTGLGGVLYFEVTDWDSW